MEITGNTQREIALSISEKISGKCDNPDKVAWEITRKLKSLKSLNHDAVRREINIVLGLESDIVDPQEVINSTTMSKNEKIRLLHVKFDYSYSNIAKSLGLTFQRVKNAIPR